MDKVTNGNDAFAFLSGFQFWMVTKSHNGRIEIVIKHSNGEYLKVWSRNNETFIEAVDRLREKAVDPCTT